jgi:hypothetical protein
MTTTHRSTRRARVRAVLTAAGALVATWVAAGAPVVKGW